MNSPPMLTATRFNHDQLLILLQRAFGGKVYLLARLSDPSLGLSGDSAPHFFIPDFHIVPDADVKYWPASVITADRRPRVTQLLSMLHEFRSACPAATFWQMGDLIDLYRIGQWSPQFPLQPRLEAAYRDWGPLLDQFDADSTLQIRRLYGNHDEELKRTRARLGKVFVPGNRSETARHDMLVIHGHQYCPEELLSVTVKAAVVHGFARAVSPHASDVRATLKAHWLPRPAFTYTPPPVPTPDERDAYLCPDLTLSRPVRLDSPSWNVKEVALGVSPRQKVLEPSGIDPSRWVRAPHPALWQDAKRDAMGAAGEGFAISLVVLAHTHNPRIVRGRTPSGRTVVMMDCGAWLGPRYLCPDLPGPIHCSTVGVRIGNDLRLYQLGADAYDWSPG